MDAIKSKKLYKVQDATYKIFTGKGMLTLIKASESYWDWLGSEDYWPREYHSGSMFPNEKVPHLINSFFFRPVFIARKVTYGKYRIYLRQALDLTSNLSQKNLSVKISVKQNDIH